MPEQHPSIADILGRSIADAGRFARSTSSLALAEVTGSLGSAAKGVGALVAGLFVVLVGLLFLLHAAVAFLVAKGFAEFVAYLIVGGGAFALGALIIVIGALLLRRASPVPRRAIREVTALFETGGMSDGKIR